GCGAGGFRREPERDSDTRAGSKPMSRSAKGFCHGLCGAVRTSWLGDTMTRACLQPAHTLDSATQKRRSLLRTFGRVTVLLYTARWWRKARFSTMTWRI